MLPLYGLVIVTIANPGDFRYEVDNPRNLVLSFGMNLLFYPAFTLLLLIALGFIRDVFLTERKQRIAPLLTTMFFYIWTFVLFSNRPNIPDVIDYLLLGSTIAVGAAFVSTVLFFKVSLHTLGFGVLIMLIIGLMSYSDINLLLLLLATIVTGGLIGTARLLVGEHTPREVLGGYLMGIACQASAFVFLG